MYENYRTALEMAREDQRDSADPMEAGLILARATIYLDFLNSGRAPNAADLSGCNHAQATLNEPAGLDARARASSGLPAS